MEDLKTLPIRASRLALGQILTPILLLSLSEWIGLAWISLRRWHRRASPSSRWH